MGEPKHDPEYAHIDVAFRSGEINAIFFASMLDQVSIPLLAPNGWEPKSLSRSQMALNTCDDNFNFGDTPAGGYWSTMHIFLKNHQSVVCPQSCHCAITFPFR